MSTPRLKSLAAIVVAVTLLSACAVTQPRPARTQEFVYVCFPGSAIKRPVARDNIYPAWMVRERGSCLRN